MNFPRLALAAGAILCIATPLAAQRSAGTPRLDWLAGCWQLGDGAEVIDEQWMAPGGGVLLGASRTTRGDSVTTWEFMRVFTRRDTVIFAAQPTGKPPSEFPAVRLGVREVVFENRAHDFPQRIIYRAVGADSLVARIEGPQGERTIGIDFPYARAACIPERRE